MNRKLLLAGIKLAILFGFTALILSVLYLFLSPHFEENEEISYKQECIASSLCDNAYSVIQLKTMGKGGRIPLVGFRIYTFSSSLQVVFHPIGEELV